MKLGIYVGDETVVHFTRGSGQEIGTGTVLDRLVFSMSPHPSDNPCPKCGDQSRLDGVISSCIDCFLSGGYLYLFEYDVSYALFIAKPRGGTCTLAKSDPQKMYFTVLLSSCKMVSVDITFSRTTAASFLAATSAVVSSPLRFLTTSFSGLAAVGYGMYCISRLVADIGVRRDVAKIPVEQLVAHPDAIESEAVADLSTAN
ncbi:hypothetical protein OIU77_001287 [Salix suchowensis]|uniref:LRAT domain-containing protein n=1 Tax=Salix suchowensis TaxID=1278906 RepID=A0ABQ9B0W4_9ROSI|nr:hypothetical protein OIU77_001287 [Salix suchowensis]